MNNISFISIAAAFFVGVVSSNIYQKQFSPGRRTSETSVVRQQMVQTNTPRKDLQTNEKTTTEQKTSQIDKSILAEAKLCQTSLQDITTKAAELEVVVRGLVTNQEERTKNWLNIKEEKLKNLSLAKKEMPTIEAKLTTLTENFEKRLEAIKNGYLKKCPCSAN